MEYAGRKSKWVLPIIVMAQFCCTSIWFASNGVLQDLVAHFQLTPLEGTQLTVSVQLGFICGTLIFAILSLADRFSPSKIFLVCAFAAALSNACLVFDQNQLGTLIGLRFLSGFCLAGIYPVGMKIAADYFEKGLGKSLGFLVGALVVGTGFPHLLKGLPAELPWKSVIFATSICALAGGLLIGTSVPDGPFRKASPKFTWSNLSKVFGDRSFNSAAIGYFGHMWELYTFWALVPMLLSFYTAEHGSIQMNIPVLSFAIIAIGGPACVLAGYLAQKWGSRKIANTSLFLSGICCLASPWMMNVATRELFLAFMVLWGITVIADSPLFSTLVAQNAAAEIKGTALTLITCIGFAITIVSIQLIQYLILWYNSYYVLLLLAIGPAIGLLAGRLINVPSPQPD